MSLNKLLLLGFALLTFALNVSKTNASSVPDQFNDIYNIVTDTIPFQDRDGDFINDDYYNPFDILPSTITQSVEYDAKTDRYILIEKIGDEYYRPPTYMTFDEYLAFRAKEEETNYFNSLAGVTSRRPSLSGKIDPMDRIDVKKSLVDKMFGGTEVTIKPQGNVDLTLGLVDYRRTTGPNINTRSQARQLYIPGDFRIDPRLNVDGSIGEKLNLGFNYDANSTFDFDKKIKLDYSTDAFNEDDIIKKIEAGNVSLPLKGNLIQGNQSLFGFKTELQFGHLRLTGIMSQQRSEQNNLAIENGAAVQDIELTTQDYDENRHFFLSHYNRDNYEDALSNLPQIKTSFRLAQIEVWVQNTRIEYQERTSTVVGLSDLGEGDINKFHNTNTIFPPIAPMAGLLDVNGKRLPDNRQSGLYSELVNDDETNEIDKVAGILSTRHRQKPLRDFETFQGRLLTTSEYTYHPQLGTISLNFGLQPDQAMAVAYKYYYTDNCDSVYTVGQISSEGNETSEPLTEEEEPDAPTVIFTKLIKPSNQQTTFPTWDLMMKNVYNLRTSSLTRDGFNFDIYYEDDQDDGSLKKYIPLDGIDRIPLLNILNVDNLNRFGDPQSDGVFDYIPGVTVIERTGSIVFPVLEPFGANLDSVFVKNGIDSLIGSKFLFNELYDTTRAIAINGFSNKNKFQLRARVESATSGEINLGPSIPRGSVRVTAGGVVLVEGQDYEIDYSLGRLRVLNPAYLSQGTPINVSYEDNGAFGFNNKRMMGLRADYDFSDKFSMGATYLRLSERPFTQKVNIGNDPINNRIFGLDLNYNEDLPWLTRAVDKLPFYSTKAPSSMALVAEGAYLRPGHPKTINLGDEKGGVVSIDDFEGAISGFTLGGFNTNIWSHSSTPFEFNEHQFADSLVYGANRAKFNWYQIDQASGSNAADRNNPYTRTINLNELFDRQVDLGQNILYTFDLSYYPEERGVYNFDTPLGYTGSTKGIDIDLQEKVVKLKDPESRWGGIMRGFQNTDFETANYEFIEFWVLNPFMDRGDGVTQPDQENGELVFNLGNVSEDIIKDNLQFYENGVPTSTNMQNIPIRNTNWGLVSLRVPINDGFDIDNIEEQDVGLDGINDAAEREKYADYLSDFTGLPEVFSDPSGDNFVAVNDSKFDGTQATLLERYKGFNNPQGNAPRNNQNGVGDSFVRGNSLPESEDLNNNRTLDNTEQYWEYRLPIHKMDNELDTAAATEYYRETKIVNRNGATEKWYRFQIPLSTGKSINEMAGFRSIKFMRMYMTKFKTPKTFRLADFQLVRSLWRRSKNICENDGPNEAIFSVDKVGVQENSTRSPFNYKTPKNIKQEQALGTFGNLLLDEKSMVLKFAKLPNTCQVAVSKLAKLNITQYKKLQMFVHLEKGEEELKDGDLSIFIKVGKDLEDNFYEYEMPLAVSDIAFPSKESNIWPDTNFISIELEKFLDVKKLKLAGLANPGPKGSFEMDDPDNVGAKIRIRGVPSLGFVKQIEVGVRNRSGENGKDGQIWINELRLTGLEEKGGVAAQARMQIKMADFGDLNLSANYSSIGFGALDQKLQERSQEELVQYDAATTLQLGKILPPVLKLNLPFYAQYSKSISTPKFDPYQLDISTNEVLAVTPEADKADVRERAKTTTTIKSYNFTNVKFDVGDGKMPWSPKNLSATYAWTEKEVTDPIIESEKETETKLGMDYRYSMKPAYIKPFKFIKSKYFKVISDFNFNLIPNTFSFNTTLNRFTNVKRFRLPDTPVFQFDDQRFKWDRNYNLDWDLAKSLRFTFKVQTTSLVDELRQVGIADDPADRDYVDENGVKQPLAVDDPNYVKQYRNNNLKNLGRAKNYNHNLGLTFRVPFKSIRALDWISATADYKGQYTWTGGPLITIDDLDTPLGNIIQNNQTRSFNPTFNFEKLYKKSKYLTMVQNGGKKSRSRSRKTRTRTSKSKDDKATDDGKDGDKKKDKKEKGERTPSKIERAIVRPFLMLRTVKFTYREDFGTVIPGFMQESSLLGLSEGFGAPGFAFAGGIQPDFNKDNPNNWLQTNQDWLNPSKNFNDQISQTRRQTINAKISLEPFKGFDIDIDFNKQYNRNHTEIFKQKSSGDQFNQVALYDVGGFEVTHFGLNTLFRDNVELLQQFKQNRAAVSNALPNKQNPGEHPESAQYAEGYGPLSYAVNVPAFLAAYTGQSVDQVSLDLEKEISDVNYIPKPNWQVRYDGLSKLKMFKGVFKSVQIKHGYKSTMAVSRFNTSPDYNKDTEYSKFSDQDNYYAELEIPSLTINEQFSPLIGVSVKTESDMSLNFEWKKSRQLNLNLQSKNLSEDLSNEIVFGFGYILKDFKGFTSKKKRKGKRPGKKDADKDDDDKKKKKSPIDFSKGGLVTNEKGRTLTMNLDFSLRDNINIIYRLDDATEGEPNRGQLAWSVEPSLEYQLYKNLALRWTAQFMVSNPYNTRSNDVTSFNTGVTVRFNFN